MSTGGTSSTSAIGSGATSGGGAAFSGTSIVGKNQDATCYVGNLEERATDSLLWELFLQVAPVVSVHIPRDRLNQTHFGYGFVELQSESDAEYASKILHGIKLYAKPLKVNKASADRRNLDVGANLFIGNLDPMVDDSMLMDTFKAFGSVISAKIAREGENGTGASRGFGFVGYDSFEAADSAIESMSGQFLCNRPITVSYAFKKDGKGERHGSASERLLAAQAKKTFPSPVQQAPVAAPTFSGYRPAQFMPTQPQQFDPNYAAMMMMMHQQQQQQQQQYPPQQQQFMNPQNQAEYFAQYQLHLQQYMQSQQQQPPQ